MVYKYKTILIIALIILMIGLFYFLIQVINKDNSEENQITEEIVNSQSMDDKTSSRDSEDNSAMEVGWVRKSFIPSESTTNEPVWNIEYPFNWQVNEGGLHEGYLGLSGEYNGNLYSVDFSYPIAEQGFENWVDEENKNHAQPNSEIMKVVINGNQALKALNLKGKTILYEGKEVEPIYHSVYVYQKGYVISIYQLNSPQNPEEMEAILNRIVNSVI
ncbi:MAG: hypothetical protein QG609_497 [Patescibacteria group bacterium]|nr:hypothetical protein [Patescibacteria group bacterium]